ncbi:MAG TPA: class I SAM-dependent methyltransferase [Saprospiraceae bacterium]|nr:class I SAM-dependent methyltransferase [Saprospiraceae bacterium]
MKYVRKLYYTFNPKMRFKVRRIYYFLYDLLISDSDLPPMGLIYTGAGNFRKQGLEWKSFFINYGLKPESSFLDIGSGIGRIALGLRDYLNGQYEGFEAMEIGVKWCKDNITTKYPNFQFKWVQLYNDLYNSDGKDASKYQFEYKDNAFDFAASISVFTHMVDREVENYLLQTNRVLKNDGLLVATFFIFDDCQIESKKKYKDFSFPFEYDNYYLMDKKVKSANVCFKKTYLTKIIENAGFQIVDEIKGYWSGSSKIHYLGFQDIIVLKKVKNIQV